MRLALAASWAAAALSCNASLWPDYNFDGNNLPNQPASTTCESPAACASLCCATPGCLFFTLNAGSGPRDCYLKNTVALRSNPGAVSGMMNGTGPPGPPPPPSPPPAGFLDAVKDCGCDNSGASDTTVRLQACIDRAYGHTLPRVPVLLPAGTYLVSGTIKLQQDNPGPDDGINVCPSRFLPHALIGAPVSAGSPRPTLVLAASALGFAGAGGPGASPYVPVVTLGDGGVNMNMLFKGIDIDLTRAGNAGACGIYHAGAQGAAVTDSTVRAGAASFACFCGMNGAGGQHSNIRCDGARYGVYIDASQPVPSGVGVTLVNQSISAIYFNAQETLSLVGATIVVPASATGPAITQTGDSGMTLVDVSIACAGGGGAAAAQTAISTERSLFLRNVYVSGCGTAINQAGAPLVPGPPAAQPWLHLASYAKGVNRSAYYVADVVYEGGARIVGGRRLVSDGAAPPDDLVSQHIWLEGTFPDRGAPGVADARVDCGARGDGKADDTVALQSCLNRPGGRVFLPPGMYRISDTLDIAAGGALVGYNNAASMLLAATGGFPRATAAAPLPMLRTADDAAGTSTTIAFIGIVTWQHLANIFTLDWRSQSATSNWRTNFESRDSECLWLSAYQQLSPTIVPCSLPLNITIPRTLVRGLGRFYQFVNDDTGHIVSTGAAYRAILVEGARGTEAARLRFYSLNLEHAQSEANGEIRNSSFVDVYSVKGEGNAVILWVRADTSNVSILGFGGDPTAFPYNFTYPPDFAQLTPSMFRIDAGARGAVLASLLDHGSGSSPPYWPPSGGGCTWGHYYPYPGTSTPLYPFWTFPNVTMWHCWFGYFTSTSFYYQVGDGNGEAGQHSAFCDKPVYYSTE